MEKPSFLVSKKPPSAFRIIVDWVFLLSGVAVAAVAWMTRILGQTELGKAALFLVAAALVLSAAAFVIRDLRRRQWGLVSKVLVAACLVSALGVVLSLLSERVLGG